jgi:hypothetical protein
LKYLTVKLSTVSRRASVCGRSPAEAQKVRTCDRCHKVEEIVVAIMQILPLEETWALCDSCLREMPAGYHLA